MKQKLLTLMTLLLCAVSGAWADVDPDYESYDWDSSEAATAGLTKTTGNPLISVTTGGSIGNVSGHYYVPLNSAIDGSAANLGTHLTISSTKQIDRISVLYCPNGTSFTNLAWAAWGKGVTPSAEVGTNYGVTTGTTSSKSWDNAIWETIDVSSKDVYTVYISRQIKKMTNSGTNIQIGENQTVNVLGIKVWLVDEGATKYTVTYAAGEGSGSMSGAEYAAGKEFTLPACAFLAPTNKAFSGWLCDIDGVTYAAGDTYTMTAAATTFTAQYKKITQKVIYSLTGGVGTAEVTATEATVNEGTSLVLSNTNGRIKLTPASGEKFKNGDLISFSGTIGNTSKKYGIKYAPTSSVSTELSVAGTTSPLEVSGTLTLAGDADNLYIGRADGTTTTLTSLVIIRPTFAAEVSISEYEWATLVSKDALDFSGVSGLSAYIVTDHSGNAITTTKMTGTVPANTPLLLGGAEGNYDIPVAASSSTDVSANKLKAGTGAAVSAEGGKTKYVLSVSGGKAAFKKINATAATVDEGKAYLEFNEEIEAPLFDLDGEATSIKAVEAKTVENGEYYNLAGQRVAQPTKGLYIVNGKKVIIK